MAYLRSSGIQTPTYRKDSWEINWKKRRGQHVWARNRLSKMPKSRGWHWIDYKTVQNSGMKWRHANINNGRFIAGGGYVYLSKRALSLEDIKIAEKFGLFTGTNKGYVYEHKLSAVKKYGRSLKGMVVRHINGIKTDNRQSNLILGSLKENNQDHNKARLSAMKWREKYYALRASIK